ncbi:MAG: hypothetical protein ACRCTQ_03500 [Brevinemataceae bacterium]
MLKKITMLVAITLAGCAVNPADKQSRQSLVESGEYAGQSKKSSVFLTPEEARAYVEGFASDYEPIVGAYFPIDNKYAMYVKEDTVFETRNIGESVDNPILVFKASNPSAIGDQIVTIYMDTNSGITPKFEITSKTSANFELTIETVSGISITKEIEIEIIEDKLYLDKVAVGIKKPIIDKENTADDVDRLMYALTFNRKYVATKNVFAGEYGGKNLFINKNGTEIETYAKIENKKVLALSFRILNKNSNESDIYKMEGVFGEQNILSSTLAGFSLVVDNTTVIPGFTNYVELIDGQFILNGVTIASEVK